MASIVRQTLAAWEAVVVDGLSTDGTWERLTVWAAQDGRVRLYREPPLGIYPAFNECLRRARGEFVYIATSDDTMEPACLERLVQLLDAHPECGVAQCGLMLIDSGGVPLPAERQWPTYTLGAFDPDQVRRPHVSPAPYRGLLYPALFTACTSVTQLLVRRSVFERFGLFENRWGSMGDFEWGMRVGLVENIVFTPEPLASWRLHPTQATRDVHTVRARQEMLEMGRTAFARGRRHRPELFASVDEDCFLDFLILDMVRLGWSQDASWWRKLGVALRESVRHPAAVLSLVGMRLQGESWPPVSGEVRFRRLRRLLEASGVRRPAFK